MNRMQAWSGMFGVGAEAGLVSPDYAVFKIIGKDLTRLVLSRLKAPDLVAQFALASRGIGSGFNRLYSDKLGAIRISLPPPEEQAAIVRFLDHANLKVEGFIRAKRKLIGLLREQKQAIIHRAVTRGLNPEAPLKSSGIPWVDDIPKHWEVVRSGSMFRLFGGYAFPGSGFFRDKTQKKLPLLLTPVNFDPAGGLRFGIKSTVWFRGPFPEQFQLRKGDLVTVLTDLSSKRLILGRAGIIDRDGVLLNQRTARVDIHATVRPRLGPDYLFWVLNSIAVREQTIATSRGSTVFHTSPTRMLAAKWPLPPLKEQKAIVSYLTDACGGIDSTIAYIEREIALVQEYRTRLTADVVTGKLDVRAAAASLPDLPADSTPELAADEVPAELEAEET